MTTDNKIFIRDALTSLLETGDTDALATLMRDDFVHRRPGSTSSRDEWLTSVRAALVPLAGMQVEVHHLLGDGEHVVVHSRRRLPGGPETTVVDICRVTDGLLAEIWEVIEPADRAEANLRWWERD